MRERHWIDDVRTGDAGAWSRLVRENFPRVYRMLANLTRDAHMAEDLCQDTFATACAKIETFAGECAIGTWLHRIAYRKFLDSRRSRQGGPPRGTESTASTDWRDKRASDPLAGLMLDEQSASLHVALAKLDETHRAMLVLHYMQDLSYREMSDVMGEPVGTLKWRTKLALEQLSALMRAEMSDEQTRDKKPGEAVATDAVATDPAGA